MHFTPHAQQHCCGARTEHRACQIACLPVSHLQNRRLSRS